MYNVLIADDNRQIVSILSEYCKKNNFNVSLHTMAKKLSIK